MGKSPDVNFPEPLDPGPAIAQQQQGNVEAAIASTLLNQVNQFGPGGSSVFSPTGQSTQVGGFNIPQFQQQVTLSPQAQQQFDAQQALSNQLTQLAGFNVGQVANAQSTPFSTAGLPDIATGVSAGQVQGAPAPSFGQIQGQLSPQGGFFGAPISTSIQGFSPQAPQGGGFQFAPQAQGGPQRAVPGQLPNISGGGVPPGLFGIGGRGNIGGRGGFNLGIGGEGGFAQQGQELEQATFARARNLLEPEFQRQLGGANIALSERGLPIGSEAAGGLLNPIFQQQERALTDAALQSVGAGRQEQQRLADLSLRTQGQGFGQGLAGAQFGQSEAARQFGEQLSGQEFGQSEAQRAFAQAAASGQFANQAQAQEFAQSLGLQGAQNVAQQQAFQQAVQNAQLQTGARQQGFQELAFQRGLPINEIATLLGTAGGVQIPQFQQQPAFGINAADTIGATLGANQQNINLATTQQEAQSSQLGGLFDLAGSLGSAAIFASDRRIKRDIEELGTWKGVKSYSYRYLGETERRVGVMAQEVEKIYPDAVVEINGIKHVDYGVLNAA